MGFLKRLVTSTSFVDPIATVLRRKTREGMKDRNGRIAAAPKGPVDTKPTLNDESESPPTRYKYSSKEVPCNKSSKRLLKCHHSKQEAKT